MKGYKKLFLNDLPSKTIENSFNVLNRQTWTNQKEQWKNSARGEESRNECRLCGGGGVLSGECRVVSGEEESGV